MLDRQQIFEALKKNIDKSDHSIATIVQEMCDDDILPFYFQKGADYYYLVYISLNGGYKVAESITSLHFSDDITKTTLTKDADNNYLWRVADYLVGIDEKVQESKQKAAEAAKPLQLEERPSYETQFTVMKDIRGLLQEVLKELKYANNH